MSAFRLSNLRNSSQNRGFVLVAGQEIDATVTVRTCTDYQGNAGRPTDETPEPCRSRAPHAAACIVEHCVLPNGHCAAVLRHGTEVAVSSLPCDKNARAADRKTHYPKRMPQSEQHSNCPN